jgi:hypothetical protein
MIAFDEMFVEKLAHGSQTSAKSISRLHYFARETISFMRVCHFALVAKASGDASYFGMPDEKLRKFDGLSFPVPNAIQRRHCGFPSKLVYLVGVAHPLPESA